MKQLLHNSLEEFLYPTVHLGRHLKLVLCGNPLLVCHIRGLGEVRLARHTEDRHLCSHLLEKLTPPLGDAIKARQAGPIAHHHPAVGPSVVGRIEGAVLLLAGGVQDLKGNKGVPNKQLLGEEIGPTGGPVGGGEPVAC
uniref:Uncharacterized protein n=1 Tax=Arcella intermedia TaxID=1963864 RepID=A0A6B2LNG5_9EUKA